MKHLNIYSIIRKNTDNVVLFSNSGIISNNYRGCHVNSNVLFSIVVTLELGFGRCYFNW